VELAPREYLRWVWGPRRRERLEPVRRNEMDALAQEAIREPGPETELAADWVHRPDRWNSGRLGVSSMAI
jgi:hypothetical protein